MPEFVLPEFMRSLRALALPSGATAEDEAALTPLLQARQLAHRAQSMEAQMAAFDAARLERAWRSSIAALAAARHPRAAPDRRALEAELDQLALPLWEALAGLARAGGAAKGAKGDARRTAWEEWVAQVQGVFRAADDWWLEVRRLLARRDERKLERARSRPLWRRLLGGVA